MSRDFRETIEIQSLTCKIKPFVHHCNATATRLRKNSYVMSLTSTVACFSSTNVIYWNRKWLAPLILMMTSSKDSCTINSKKLKWWRHPFIQNNRNEGVFIATTHVEMKGKKLVVFTMSKVLISWAGGRNSILWKTAYNRKITTVEEKLLIILGEIVAVHFANTVLYFGSHPEP